MTDGQRSFSIFLYLDDGIQWGEGAQIGFDAVQTELGSLISDRNLFPLSFSLPGALGNESVDIELTENTGTLGKWVFRMDTELILEAGREFKIVVIVIVLLLFLKLVVIVIVIIIIIVVVVVVVLLLPLYIHRNTR